MVRSVLKGQRIIENKMKNPIYIKFYFLLLLLILGVTMFIMGLFNWGPLPKAQDDPTTIDEAIASAISAHESDPTAHLGDGESLQAHKSNEIIDHPAFSVVADKPAPYLSGALSYRENGMTFDKWDLYNVGTNSELTSSNFYMYAHVEDPAPARADAYLVNSPYKVHYADDYLFLEFIGLFNYSSDVDSWVGCGYGLVNSTGVGFGFLYQRSDSHIYAFHRSGTTYYKTDLGLAETDTKHKYRVELKDNTFIYYIDDLQVAVFSTNMPTGSDTSLITMGVVASSGHSGSVEVDYFDYYLSSSPEF